jgi:riboflavin kinase / FMN adenylyltransferase
VQLEQELTGFTSDRDSMVAIGVFDGVHLGHKYLISQLKELAAKQGYCNVVIKFDKSPQKVLKPHSHPLFLTNAVEKAVLLIQKLWMPLFFSLLASAFTVLVHIIKFIFGPTANWSNR